MSNKSALLHVSDMYWTLLNTYIRVFNYCKKSPEHVSGLKPGSGFLPLTSNIYIQHRQRILEITLLYLCVWLVQIRTDRMSVMAATRNIRIRAYCKHACINKETRGNCTTLSNLSIVNWNSMLKQLTNGYLTA